MKRIHMHWTAGGSAITEHERDSYHFLVTADGTVLPGDYPVEANIPPLRPGAYAAHTLNANSWAIGIAVDAMAGAVERPFDPGLNPITDAQIRALVQKVAVLAMTWDIPVRRDTILTHAEVAGTLGIPQRGKWDICWLPGMSAPDSALAIGDRLRAMVQSEIDLRMAAEETGRGTPAPPRHLHRTSPGWLRWLLGAA